MLSLFYGPAATYGLVIAWVAEVSGGAVCGIFRLLFAGVCRPAVQVEGRRPQPQNRGPMGVAFLRGGTCMPPKDGGDDSLYFSPVLDAVAVARGAGGKVRELRGSRLLGRRVAAPVGLRLSFRAAALWACAKFSGTRNPFPGRSFGTCCLGPGLPF